MRRSGRSRDDVLRAFGVYTATKTFPALFPDYHRESGNTRAFLLGVEKRIHDVVRATIEGALPPKLHVMPLGADGVAISYTSERMLCRLLEGLVHGTAETYGETFVIDEMQCMRRGDIACAFTVQPA